MKTEDFGLSQEIVDRILQVISTFPEVEKVILYGSRAKGTHRPGSDIDLVLIVPKMSFDRYLALYVQLKELELPYIIDLTKFELLNQDMKDHIVRVGKEIYSKTKNDEVEAR